MQRQNFSFVVRVWLESNHDDGRHLVWRGSIEQVGTDSKTYFSDLEGISQFIRSEVGLEPEKFFERVARFWNQFWHLLRKF